MNSLMISCNTSSEILDRSNRDCLLPGQLVGGNEMSLSLGYVMKNNGLHNLE